MIEGLKKHVGQLANTGVRVAVVFRKLPNDDNNCLIVETERLPDSYQDYMLQALNSKEAIDTNDFYQVLDRRTFPDGLNCLTALHQRGHLRKEPVANVNMIPLPGKIVPLSLINSTIDKKADTTAKTVEIMAANNAPEGDPAAIAKGLILQAELLEKDAAAKREEAYTLDPASKPTPGRPALPEEVRAQKLLERQAKRLERDRANAKIAKVVKKESALDAKVAAKIAETMVERTGYASVFENPQWLESDRDKIFKDKYPNQNLGIVSKITKELLTT